MRCPSESSPTRPSARSGSPRRSSWRCPAPQGRPIPRNHRPPPHLDSAANTTSRLTAPESISLGTLRPGQSGKATLTVRNETAVPIHVDRFETSCPCLKADSSRIVVDGNSSSTLILQYDGSSEPSFRGRLSVAIEGKSGDGTVLFQTRATLEVHAPEDPVGKSARPLERGRG